MFKPDTIFNGSHKMGSATISLKKALAKFPETNEDDCEKVEYSWSGSFTASDGTVLRVSFWDYKGTLRMSNQVSLWISNPAYLDEFKRYIEA